MSTSKEEKNKALVLEAFDTLFNKRDYAAAEQFWSSEYIQHSAHIGHRASIRMSDQDHLPLLCIDGSFSPKTS
jgi:hypothetical protein